MDIVDKPTRSRMMASIRSRDTKPELVVRRLLHGFGYRFRTHASHLIGRPDIVFAARQRVVFVHGCFWHGHTGCRYAYKPKTRSAWWRAKINANRRRDRKVLRNLAKDGWSAQVVWECECRDPAAVGESLMAFLGPVRWLTEETRKRP